MKNWNTLKNNYLNASKIMEDEDIFLKCIQDDVLKVLREYPELINDFPDEEKNIFYSMLEAEDEKLRTLKFNFSKM